MNINTKQLIGKYSTNKIYANTQAILDINKGRFQTTIIIETQNQDQFDACILISSGFPIFFDIKRIQSVLLFSCTLVDSQQQYSCALFYIDPEYSTAIDLDSVIQKKSSPYTLICKKVQHKTLVYLGQNDFQVTNFKNINIQHINTFKKYSLNQRLIFLIENNEVLEKQIKIDVLQAYKTSEPKFQQQQFLQDVDNYFNNQLLIGHHLHDAILFDQNSLQQIQDFKQLITTTELCDHQILSAQFVSNQLIIISWGKTALNQFQMRIYQQCQFKTLFTVESSMKLLYTYNLPNIKRLIGKRTQWLFFPDQCIERDSSVRFQLHTLSNNNQILLIQIFRNFQLKTIAMHVQTGSYIKLQNIYFYDLNPILEANTIHYIQLLKINGINKQNSNFQQELQFLRKINKIQLNLINQTTVLIYRNCIEYYVPNIMNLQVTKYIISAFPHIPLKIVLKQKQKIYLQTNSQQKNIYNVRSYDNSDLLQYKLNMSLNQLNELSRELSVDTADLQISQQEYQSMVTDSYISEQSTMIDSEQEIEFDTQYTDSESLSTQNNTQQENQFNCAIRDEVTKQYYLNYHLFGNEQHNYIEQQRFQQLKQQNPLDFQQINKSQQIQHIEQLYLQNQVYDRLNSEYIQFDIENLITRCDDQYDFSQVLNFYNNIIFYSCQLLGVQKNQIIQMCKDLLEIQDNTNKLTFQYLQTRILELIQKYQKEQIQYDSNLIISIFRLASTIMKIQTMDEIKITAQYIIAEETYYQLISQQTSGNKPTYNVYNCIVIDKTLDLANRKLFHYLFQYCSNNSLFLQQYWKNIFDQSDLLLGLSYESYDQLIKLKRTFLGFYYNVIFEQQNVRQYIQKVYTKDKELENQCRTYQGTEILFSIDKYFLQLKKQLQNLLVDQKIFNNFKFNDDLFLIEYCRILETVCVNNEILYDANVNVISQQKFQQYWFTNLIQQRFNNKEITSQLQHQVYDTKYFIKMNGTFVPYSQIPLSKDYYLKQSQSLHQSMSVQSFISQESNTNISQLQALKSPVQQSSIQKSQFIGRENHYQKLYNQLHNHIYQQVDQSFNSKQRTILQILQKVLQIKQIEYKQEIDILIKDNTINSLTQITDIVNNLLDFIYERPQLKAILFECLSRNNISTQKEDILQILQQTNE